MTEPAKADVRRLDKPTAMRILSALHRFAESDTGDVRALQGEREELRLRIGGYRLFFATSSPSPTRHSGARLPLFPSFPRRGQFGLRIGRQT